MKNNNSKQLILGSVQNSTFDLENDKIKKDEDLKTKMNQMLEVADKVKNIFESIDDFNLFLSIINKLDKSFIKDSKKEKIYEKRD